MAVMQEIKCRCGCGRKRMVRAADVKRGWGLYFDKRCKAREQESRTGQYRKFKEREEGIFTGAFSNESHHQDSY